jgi:hypothetical protein
LRAGARLLTRARVKEIRRFGLRTQQVHGQ